MRHVVAWLVGAAVVGALACSSFTASSSATPPAIDGGTEAGIEAGTGCPTVFVSRTGDDAHDGCDQAAPMQSIAAAISRAEAKTAKDVHVCAGVYDEQSLVLDAPISIRGGYDCTTWLRPSGFGFPSFANGAVETRITRVGTSAGANTLAITGASIGRDIEIEGITVFGPDQGTHGTAISVIDGASPSIHDVDVHGGATMGTIGATGSIGISVLQNSRPEIMHDRIDGGLGTIGDDGSVVGTTGLVISGASPLVHDDIINGGSSAVPSIGVLVGSSTLTGENALSRLHITAAGATYLGLGVSIASASTVDLVDSVVDLVRVGCDGDHDCSGAAVHVADTSTVHISRNRIAGADITGRSGAVYGVVMAKSTGVIDNNEIFAGNSLVHTGTLAFAIDLGGSAGVSIVHNTIDAGPSAQAFGITLHDKSSDTVIDGNLLLTSGTSTTGIFRANCDGASVAHTHQNAFVGDIPLTLTQDSACKAGSTNLVATVTMADADAQLIGTATDNFELTTSCAANDPRCAQLACTTAESCSATLFQSTGLTRAALVETGWRLAPTIPCQLVPVPDDPSATLGNDVFGQPRRAPFTVGAEQTSTCIEP